MDRADIFFVNVGDAIVEEGGVRDVADKANSSTP
jgi:hypothetical protein